MDRLGCRLLVAALVVGGCAKPPTTSPVASVHEKAAPAAVAPLREVSGRAPVQHGIDPQASLVNRTPQKVTVEQLLAMRKRFGDSVDLSKYPTRRIAPFETTTFAIDATIKSIKHEKDGDFYMVLEGDSGAKAVVEVPDPSLCQGSPMLADISHARQVLADRFHPTADDRQVNQRATIEGVGYLGSRKRRGSGTFGAAARLMPGTGVSFPRP